MLTLTNTQQPFEIEQWKQHQPKKEEFKTLRKTKNISNQNGGVHSNCD